MAAFSYLVEKSAMARRLFKVLNDPTWAALLTGYYPQQIRMDPPRGRLPDWTRLLPRYLSGVHCAAFSVAGAAGGYRAVSRQISRGPGCDSPPAARTPVELGFGQGGLSPLEPEVLPHWNLRDAESRNKSVPAKSRAPFARQVVPRR